MCFESRDQKNRKTIVFFVGFLQSMNRKPTKYFFFWSPGSKNLQKTMVFLVFLLFPKPRACAGARSGQSERQSVKNQNKNRKQKNNVFCTFLESRDQKKQKQKESSSDSEDSEEDIEDIPMPSNFLSLKM